MYEDSNLRADAKLREHGLIKKLPNQRKYALTDKGRKLTAALDAALAASVNDLLKSEGLRQATCPTTLSSTGA